MTKKLLPLFIIAVVLVGAALLLTHRNRPRTVSPDVGGALAPGLADRLTAGDVSEISLVRGDLRASLELDDGRWVVRELFGYPADFARLQRALLGLSQVTLGQALPAASLDPEQTVRVSWAGADGETIGAVELGQTRSAPVGEDASPWGGVPGGRFVRREGEGTVFLVRESLGDFVAQPSSWVETRLLSVPAMDVVRVRITHPDGEVVRLGKVAGELSLEDLAGGETFDSSKRHGVGSAMSFLRFTEIADPSLDPSVTGLDEPVRYEVTTVNGRVYEARIGASPEGRTERYARFQVTLPPAEPRDVPEDESEEQRDERERIEASRAELERETAEKNARLAPWTFLLPSHSADNMTQRREALVKLEPPSEASSPADQAEVPVPAPAGEEPAATDEPPLG